MFQAGPVDDFPETPPPPIPPRNPLRNDTHRLEKQTARPRKKSDSTITFTGQSTLHSIAESSREHFDTAFALASSRHANREVICDELSIRAEPHSECPPHRLSFLSDDEESASLVSRRSSWSSGLKRLYLVLDRRAPSTVQSLRVKSKRQRDIEEAMANLRSKLDNADADTDSLTSISSYDRVSRHEVTARNDEENSPVEAWLQRGTIDSQSLKSTCTSDTKSAPKSPSTKKSAALNIFPPTSPNTGKREYIYPSSPMNNGRDAYGNYIPTNTQDYTTVRCRPTSPKLRTDEENTSTSGQNSTARLRGGGGWWNSLGIGFDDRDSPESKQAEPAGQETIRRHTRAQSLRTKRQFGNPSQYAASVLSDGGGSSVQRSLVGEMAIPMSLQQTRPIQSHGHTSPKSAGSQRSNNQSLETHSKSQHPSSRTYTNNDQVLISSRPHPRPLYEEAMFQTSSAHLPTSKAFAIASKKAESSWSGVSYTPRAKKKWNQAPASGPPSSVAMPPPPLPLRTTTDSEVLSSVGVLSLTKYRYERPNSPVESYDDQGWELQSLQLGESVSVAGGPRRTIGGASRPRNARFDPEEFEAAQRIAQVEFRPLCQDIMARYNAEISRVQRAFKEGKMEPEQYKYHLDWNVRNKDQALKHSAERTGYVVSIQPFPTQIHNYA